MFFIFFCLEATEHQILKQVITGMVTQLAARDLAVHINIPVSPEILTKVNHHLAFKTVREFELL